MRLNETYLEVPVVSKPELTLDDLFMARQAALEAYRIADERLKKAQQTEAQLRRLTQPYGC